MRDHPAEWDGRWDAYSEAGINERGVSCSATLSTSYNDDAKAADPTTKHAHKANPEVKNTGIGEYSYAGVILGESATAREGVELIGSLIDEQGVCSNDQIVIADNTETWLFAALSGHQWIAMKLTDDVASVNPNISNLNFQVNLDDPENCLHSEGIKTMPEEKASPSTLKTDSSMLPRPTVHLSTIRAWALGRVISRAATTLWLR